MPTQTVPIAILTDIVEVLLFNREAGPTLAGAIALVSPANKDRPAHRDAFVSKCATYLQQVEAGETLVIVRDGQPVAEVKPVRARLQTLRPFGLCTGEIGRASCRERVYVLV